MSWYEVFTTKANIAIYNLDRNSSTLASFMDELFPKPIFQPTSPLQIAEMIEDQYRFALSVGNHKDPRMVLARNLLLDMAASSYAFYGVCSETQQEVEKIKNMMKAS